MGEFSISSGKSYFAANHWIPAFAGMTGIYTQLSFPRRRESSSCYLGLLGCYLVPRVKLGHLLQKCSFFLIKLAVFLASGGADP